MNYKIPTKKTAANTVVGVLTAIGLAVAAHSAQAAACINGPGMPIVPPAEAQGAGATCGLTATGTKVQVVFAYVSAADEDTLSLGGLIFNNRTSIPGDEVSINTSVSEPLPFLFANLTTGILNYTNASPSTSPDGLPHTAYSAVLGTAITTSSAANFFTDPPRVPVTLAAAVPAAMNLIDTNPADWLFIGFEDLTKGESGDFDYNDLVFAFHNVAAPPPPVPEPASLALLGMGLVGLGMVRRRRR